MDYSEESLITGGWTNRRALSLVSLAQAAYAPPVDLAYLLEVDFDLDLVDMMPAGSSQGFVAEGPGVVALAFSGTNQLADWLTNLRITVCDTRWGTAHCGFLAAYAQAATQVRAAADLARAKNKAFWITGHSLGGALAHVAAHDLADVTAPMGLCTFGQPRTVNVADDRLLGPRLALGHHRIVHRNDIVTRVPPRFAHTGELVQLGTRKSWFGLEADGGDQGGDQGGDDAGGADTGGPDPMDVAEFEAFQARLEAVRTAAVASVPPGARDDLGTERERAVDRTVEGLIPGIKDHKITVYHAAVRQLVAGLHDTGGLFDDVIREAPVAGGRRSAGPDVSGDVFGDDGFDDGLFDDAPAGASENVRGADHAGTESADFVADDALVAVLARLNRLDWQPPGKARVLSRVGDFITVLASPAEIAAMEDDPAIRSLDISRAGGGVELTEAMPFVKARPVDRAGSAERGGNALVGIIDTGADILHSAFDAADGSSRIVAIWDQRDTTGPSPRAVDPAFAFDFGTLHTGADIAAMRAGTRPVPDWLRDPSEHGTHVAGIAAGRATGAMPDGMAPEALIAAVIPDMETLSGNPASLGYSVSHVNALSFLKVLAARPNTLLAAPRPLAINVSLGMNAGAHDGQTLLEAAFDSATGQGRDPGVVIVKSAGNERPHRGHTQVSTALGRVDVDWTSAATERGQDYFEAWYDKLDVLEFILHAPGGDASDVVSKTADRFGGTLGGNKVNMRLRCVHPDNGDNVLYLSIRRGARDIAPGVWTLEVRGTRIGARTSGLHIWVERMAGRAVEFDDAHQTMTLSVPGTANHIVTVGATDTRMPFPGVIRASSFGPTRDNRPKPELSAPGRDILSARANRDARDATTTMTGTSMAAPMVTGAVALALSARVGQGRKALNQEQISSLLVQSTQFQSTLHHQGFGFGILDVAAFLDLCDEIP